MSVVLKVRAVERLYHALEAELTPWRELSGLSCLPGCGRCCTKPDIEAAPLEFLPLAWYYFLTRRGPEMLDYFDENPELSICHIFAANPQKIYGGSCTNYRYRGLICRLFGYATTRNKSGEPILVACRPMKEETPLEVARAQSLIATGTPTPFYTNYYQQLKNIDWELGGKYYPINQAIKIALEFVVSFYTYRPFPYRHVKKSA